MVANQRILKVLDFCVYACLLLIILTVPFLLDKHLLNFYIIPKQYGFIGLALLGIIFFTVKSALSKKISLRFSFLDKSVAAMLAITLISAIFSTNKLDSFLGRSEQFTISFLFLCFAAAVYFLIINQTKTFWRWQLAFDVLIAAGGVSALLFILKATFKIDLLNFLGVNVWNTIDKLNSSFGMWLVLIFILTAGQLIRRALPVGRSLYYFFVTVLAYAGLVMLSFNVLWWFLLLGLALLLLVGVAALKEARVGWLSVLFAILILTIIAIIFGTPRSLQTVLPAEASLDFSPSWSISLDTITSGVKNFLVGSGVGTFGYDFSKFRPESFNYDRLAWSLRFSQPLSTAFAILAEGGILLTLAFVFLFLLVVGHVLHGFFKVKTEGNSSIAGLGSEDAKIEILLFFVGWLVLSASMLVLFFTVTLWSLWWVMLGMLVVGISFMDQKTMRKKEWVIDNTPQYSLSFSFALITIMSAAVMLCVLGARLYLAERNYAEALSSGDYRKAEIALKSAISKRSNFDNYHAALAQVYLLQAAAESKSAKPDANLVNQLIASAVNEAKTATDLSPNSVTLWENLSSMYENAAAIVPEAKDWAVKTLIQTKGLEPTNATLWWRLGNAYTLDGNVAEATKSYEEAIRLKTDYLIAYDSLAAVYEGEKELDKAVLVYKDVMSLVSNSPEALFNLGRLIYNRNQTEDRLNAEKMWLQALELKPDYANVLYSLGLLYESKGDRQRALQYFYKVQEVVPDNKDISDKINKLINS